MSHDRISVGGTFEVSGIDLSVHEEAESLQAILASIDALSVPSDPRTADPLFTRRSGLVVVRHLSCLQDGAATRSCILNRICLRGQLYSAGVGWVTLLRGRNLIQAS